MAMSLRASMAIMQFTGLTIMKYIVKACEDLPAALVAAILVEVVKAALGSP